MEERKNRPGNEEKHAPNDGDPKSRTVSSTLKAGAMLVLQLILVAEILWTMNNLHNYIEYKRAEKMFNLTSMAQQIVGPENLEDMENDQLYEISQK